MRKIISLFKRNYDGDWLVRNEVVEGAEWVLNGEGRATRKWNGTCVLFEDGKMWRRFEVKNKKKPPIGFRPADAVDPSTGKQQGWLLVGDGPEDRWHREAMDNDGCVPSDYEPGTYELVGPKVMGNPEEFEDHRLIKHGSSSLEAPRTFEGIREFLLSHNIEGIVWHHPDGRMVKIKTKDFIKGFAK